MVNRKDLKDEVNRNEPNRKEPSRIQSRNTSKLMITIQTLQALGFVPFDIGRKSEYYANPFKSQDVSI